MDAMHTMQGPFFVIQASEQHFPGVNERGLLADSLSVMRRYEDPGCMGIIRRRRHGPQLMWTTKPAGLPPEGSPILRQQEAAPKAVRANLKRKEQRG